MVTNSTNFPTKIHIIFSATKPSCKFAKTPLMLWLKQTSMESEHSCGDDVLGVAGNESFPTDNAISQEETNGWHEKVQMFQKEATWDLFTWNQFNKTLNCVNKIWHQQKVMLAFVLLLLKFYQCDLVMDAVIFISSPQWIIYL